ncbi:MAG: OmpA family protein [Rhodospirillaceae bacterium]
MAQTIKIFRSGYVRKGVTISAMGMYLFAGLGCSQIPDYANPVDWYGSAKEWVTSLGQPLNSERSTNLVKSENKASFPSLGSVPARPSRTSEPVNKRIASGLIADRKSARYMDEELRAGSVTPVKPVGSSAVGNSSRMSMARDLVPNEPRVPMGRPSYSSRPSQAVPKGRVPVIPKQQRPSSITLPPQKVTSPTSTVAVSSLAEPAAARDKREARFPKREISSGRLGTDNKQMGFAQADRFSPRFPALSNLTTKGPASQKTLLGDIERDRIPIAIVYFGNNSSSLNAESKDRIRRAYSKYIKGKDGTVHVIGHASSRTPNVERSRHQIANFRVSNNRAVAVAKELLRLGVKSEKLLVSAVSDQRPAFLEVMPAGEAANRRAEIYFSQ